MIHNEMKNKSNI